MSLKVDRGRTRSRSQAMQLLFQAEALDVPLEQVLAGDYLVSKGPLEPYAVTLAEGAYEHLDEIDHGLTQVAENWDLMRMPGTDRNLLRIAVYEMRFADERIDDPIVINEAVEIAKAFGTDESSRFVNGVLGRIARGSAELFVLPEDEAEAGAPAEEVPEAEAAVDQAVNAGTDEVAEAETVPADGGEA